MDALFYSVVFCTFEHKRRFVLGRSKKGVGIYGGYGWWPEGKVEMLWVGKKWMQWSGIKYGCCGFIFGCFAVCE